MYPGVFYLERGMKKLGIVLMVAFAAMFATVGDQAAARPLKRSVSLEGVTPVLAAKAREIEATCGSVIISAISKRPIRSNHPSGRAVDVEGNPGCVYALLKDWPGGYSTDYAAVRHVHISYNPGGQEWGIRFAHGQHHGVRHAESGSQPMSYASHGADPAGATW
jgi:hypothetical protein